MNFVPMRDRIKAAAQRGKQFAVDHKAVLGLTTLVAAGAVGIGAAIGGTKTAATVALGVAALVATDVVVGVATQAILRKEAQPAPVAT